MSERLGLGLAIGAGAACVLDASPSRADTGEIRIAKQYGLAYLPLIVMEREKLYEKHAAELGISTKPIYMTLGNNTAVKKALLSGRRYVVSNRPPRLLTFLSRATA